MAYPPIVQNSKSLQELHGNRLCIGLCVVCFDILTQIAIFDILHRDEDKERIFVPAKELHKVLLALRVCQLITNFSNMVIQTSETLANAFNSRE